MNTLLSPRELAEAIGVSESSLKRWVDSGEITASRTAGGHRRIALDEAFRFIRATRAPVVRPEILGLTELEGKVTPRVEGGDEIDSLYSLLVTGQAREARGFIMSLYLEGRSIAEICDGPICESMARIGELWKSEETGVFIEHRATDICIQALNQLRLTFEPPDGAPVAVGGAPAGDPYLLPSLMAATVLGAERLRPINLGPDTPPEAFLAACEKHQPVLVWLSISSERLSEESVRATRRLIQRLDQMSISVVTGGRSRHRVGGRLPDRVHVAGAMGELLAYVRALLSVKGEAH